MEALAFQKVTSSATDITKSVVAAQVEVFDIYAKTAEGMPISSFFSVAATMQRAALQGLDTISEAFPAVETSEAKSAEETIKAATKAVKKAVNAQADAMIGADASTIAASSDATDAVVKCASDVAKGDLAALYEDLTVVAGIGPSTMKKLQAEGIQSLSDLAKTSKKDLAAIIEKANVRIIKHSPADWIADAKQQLKSLK